MKYTLYHKNHSVITFELDEKGFVPKIYQVENEGHIPVQFLLDGKIPRDDDYYPLQDSIVRWLSDRGIPSSRKNLQTVLSKLAVKNTDELAQKSFYLSLSDQYWAAPSELHLDWENINFFTNRFTDDVGAILLDSKPRGNASVNFHSPNNTSQGNLKKKWVIRGGKRILVKGGSGIEQLEPFNERLASEIYTRLDVRHVDYGLSFQNRKHYSTCENFVTKNTELITVYELCADKARAFDDYISLDELEERCKKYAIPFDKLELGKMFAVDFIIANTDRHTNNFGFLRNADTLEWLGLAPVFDSGMSLFLNCQYFELEKNGMDSGLIEAKPFAPNQLAQLRLFPLDELAKAMDLSKLNGIGAFYKSLLKQNKREVSEKKITALASVLDARVEELKTLLEEKPNSS